MKKLMLIAIAALSFTLVGATRTDALLEKLHGPDRTYVFYCMHRGDWRNAPENSMPSILGSIAKGADMIELDVRKTKDGHYILRPAIIPTSVPSRILTAAGVGVCDKVQR